MIDPKDWEKIQRAPAQGNKKIDSLLDKRLNWEEISRKES